MDEFNEDDLLEGIDLFDEAYYGKLPEFAALEKLFDRVLSKVKEEGLDKANPNKYPEMRTIEKTFEKLFGFKRASVYWEPFIYPNAYTYSMNCFLIFSDKKNHIEKTSTGFYDNSNSTTLAVFGSLGLLDGSLTNREIISFILHEIGHNFDTSIYQNIEWVISTVLSLGTMASETKKYKNKIDELRDNAIDEISKEDDKIYHNQKRRKRLMKEYEEAMKKAGKRNAILNALSIPWHVVKDIGAFILSPITLFALSGSKKGEQFADSFATAYGYGPDLISALNKLDHDGEKYYNPKSKVMRFLTDLATLQFEIDIAFTDCHGTSQERCQECIEKLKWDLKHNDFPPQLKQDLVNEINHLTNQYKKFSSFDEKERYKMTKIARKLNAILFRGRPNILKFFKRNKV